MVQDMKVNGTRKQEKEMEKVTKSGPMALCMKDTGKMIKLMEEVD